MRILYQNMEFPFQATYLLLSLSALALIYSISLVIYRLYFSPLAGFPGPKLAAATGLYEFYFDWWLNGQYIFQLEKMHKKYGNRITILSTQRSRTDSNK